VDLIRRNKGFTLVELIVVIAIIAILAAVSIVGFSSYIDNARMSNDNSAASQLTGVLSAYFITNDDENLEAHDVRAIIEEINGAPFDWETQSDNAGFFYIPEERKIIAAKFDEIIEPGFVLGSPTETTLLSDKSLAVSTGTPGNTPEEFFSEGAHLLTTSGNVVADVVTGIRDLANSNDVLAGYNALVDNAEARTTGLSGLFGGNRDVREIVDAFLDEFDPAQTLYVNNMRWLLTDDQKSQTNELWATINVERIVYARGIKNIPAFPSSGSFVEIDSIFIPNSVKTIQANAFTKFSNLNATVTYSSTASFAVASNAFNARQMDQIQGTSSVTVGLSYLLLDELDLEIDGVPSTVEFGDSVDLGTLTSLSVVVSSLPSTVLSVMTDVVISSSRGYYTIYIYSSDGIYAHFCFDARKHTVSYFSADPNTGDGVDVVGLPVDELVLSGSLVTKPADPTYVGYTFTGWYTDYECTTMFDFDDDTVSQNTVLFAGWTTP